MRGGPSHVDTFDYKPKLSAKSGALGTRPGTKLLGSKWNFAQHGQSGLWISELFPNEANHADELCLLRSMQTDLRASAGVPANEHWLVSVCPLLSRRMDALRPWHRKRKPPRLCHPIAVVDGQPELTDSKAISCH